MPYQFSPYHDRFVGSISELMQAPAQAQARAVEQVGNANANAALQSGQAWAGAAQNIGQSVSAGIQQVTDPRRKLETQQLEMGAQQLAAQKRAAALNGQVNQLMQSAMTQQPDGTVTFDRAKLRQGFAASQVPMPLQEQTFKSLDEVDKSLQAFNQVKVDHLADLAHATLTNPHGATPESFAFTAALAKANGLVNDQQLSPIIEQIANGGDVKTLLTQVRGLSEKYKDVAKPVVLPRGGTLTSPTGEVIAKGQEPAKTQAEIALEAAGGDPTTALSLMRAPVKPPNAQSESFLLDRKPVKGAFIPDAQGGKYLYNGQDVTARVKPIPSQAAVTLQQGATDAKSIADAIFAGEQPPTVQGLYRLAGPVRAELAKQGYDMTKANLDWEATKKHLSTLNGAQQTRLRQAIVTASDSLGVIEDLATQWDGGSFPLLNKVNLILAKNGTLGKEAQQIATNLEAQITDVTSELGNVYMGGNSPTDHALSLAGKNLSADWNKDQLLSAIKLARTNLQIRGNSITSSGAVLSGGPPKAAPVVPTMRYNPATGKVEPIKPSGD